MEHREEGSSTKSVTETVRQSWNKIGEIYAANRNVRKMDRELHELKSLLPRFGEVLDVGSGAGVPVAKFLVEHNFQVTGIDISDTMLELAKRNVPTAIFRKMNINKLEFEKNSFDGLVCVYVLFHIPRVNHKFVLENFHRILKPNGILLLNTGVFDSEVFSQFFDVPMFWSSHQPEVTAKLVKAVGFDLITDGVRIRGGESQYWIFARKPDSSK